MSTQDLLQAGQLEPAIESQISLVKKHPTDAEARYLLFALLCFAGQWDRAVKQLDALSVQDEKLQSGSLVYRNLLASEYERRAVFAGEGRPLLPDLDDSTKHLERRLVALEHICSENYTGAETALNEAIDLQPDLSGSINESHFNALRDQDDLLGSVLEVFAGGRYLWLPFERLRNLKVDRPSHLLDLLWLPASLEDKDGSVASVHLPVLYAGSGSHEDDEIRLGRSTEWLDQDGHLYLGAGQKVFAFAAPDAEIDEMAVTSLRTLDIPEWPDR